MFGWEDHLGHLCGGGTMANFEALWVGRELRPGRAVAASSQAHYTHSRLSAVLGVPFRKVPVDPRGRMDIPSLERAISEATSAPSWSRSARRPPGRSIRSPKILALRDRHDFRLHVNTAYGGYFTLAGNLGPRPAPPSTASGRRIRSSSTRTSTGSSPTAAAACSSATRRRPVLPARLAVYLLQLGRAAPRRDLAGMLAPGASAVALWTTMRLLPLEKGGAFARGLESCREAALMLDKALEADDRFAPLFAPELDIVVWAVQAGTATESSAGPDASSTPRPNETCTWPWPPSRG